MELSVKAKGIKESITLEITAKAKELKKQGVDIVSFGAGEPDFNTPQNIINAAIKAMENGNTKYTQSAGIIELREAICNKLKKDNELTYEADQIVVSTGAKQCLSNVFMAILNPGDEVILCNPSWISYVELIKLADGIPIFSEGDKNNGYKYSIEELERVVTNKTKAIILNTPNNPTGSVYTKEELIEIAEFAKRYSLIIISDEIYEKLIYENNNHVSIASLSKDAYDRTIVINGLSKTYSMTGWRVGYTASSKEIAKIMTSIQSHTTSNTCSIAQYASLEALTGQQEDIINMIDAFSKRRDFMMKKLDEIDGISYIKPYGAFYVMVNIENFINKKNGENIIVDSLSFSKNLLEEEKVAVIPGIAFGLENYIRLSYAIAEETINEGIDRIQKFTKKLK